MSSQILAKHNIFGQNHVPKGASGNENIYNHIILLYLLNFPKVARPLRESKSKRFYGPNGLPDKIDGVTVTGIEDYIMVHEWVTATALGGRYNWEAPDGYWDDDGYFGISIDGPTAPQKEFEFLDAMVYDGGLTTGYFRLTPNGRYTYMLEHQLD